MGPITVRSPLLSAPLAPGLRASTVPISNVPHLSSVHPTALATWSWAASACGPEVLPADLYTLAALPMELGVIALELVAKWLPSSA